MRPLKKLTALIVSAALAVSLSACGSTSNAAANSSAASGDTATLKIAMQYGLSYAPYAIMQAKGLIEKNYDGELNVEWSTLNSGSAINEAFASGKLDVGAMGLGPAITGITSGVGYKIYDNISSMPNKLYTNKDNINSLSDITGSDQIAIVNVGSFQHILLALACDKELGDAHALDNNLVAMAHPDGMSSLMSGSVALHLTSAPYTFQEDDDENLHEIYNFNTVWPEGNSFIVGLASTKLNEEQPDLYNAVVKATEEAMDFIKENPDEAAEILAEVNDKDVDTIKDWLGRDGVNFSARTGGVVEFASFMEKNDFLTNEASKDYSAYVFDNVQGD
ncbi:MAG: ABC transporter substrate-binding protein [Lachnospiraceae bacterium]|nr:ABC transporter substrate-binding protein [Lachnospiraceae bacterium]